MCRPESNAPKTNKRFLSSIIRNTDDHNKVILRAQALAAQEIKREREESERRERRLRAEEAVAAERMRRLMKGSSRWRESDSWDRRERRGKDRKRKDRSWSVEEDDNASRARRTRRLTPELESPSLKRQSHPNTVSSSSRIPISPATLSRSPSPQPVVSQLPSKMDKYFEASYDPRLDVASLSAPSIPASGLIDSAQFEGWDAMLELLRMRKEDKEEKKRMERLGLTKDKRKDRKKNKGDSIGTTDRCDVGVSIMDIEYKKKGAVREWDMGKEGF